MNSSLLLQSAVNGLASGALFALFGLSFGIIYSTTQILHFAHGAIFLCAAYLFYVVYTAADWPLAPAMAACLTGAGFLGWATMQVLYRPLIARRTSGAVVMIASLGLYISVENMVVMGFGNASRVVSKGSVQSGIDLGNVYVTPLQITTVATCLIVAFLTFLLITRSKLGRGLRAIADDTEVAELVGIDVKRLRQAVFVIGSMVLAIAAILNANDIGVSPGMGLSVVLVAAVAAIVGGANSIFAGIAGGFLIGTIQSFGVIWIDSRWQNLLIFSTLIVILMVRPTGVFGAKQR